MTITELRDRLNTIIADNEKRGWAERNNNQVAIYIRKSPRKWEYRGIESIWGGELSLNELKVLEMRTETTPLYQV